MQFNVSQKCEFFLISLSITFLNSQILGSLFAQKIALPEQWNVKNQTSENRREFFREASKMEHEWNGPVEILAVLKK